MLQRRGAIVPQVRRFAPVRVADLGCQLLGDRKGLVIGGYYPTGSELDPRILMQDLERRGHSLALPVVVGDDQPLMFRQYAIGDALVEGAYGIPVPDEAAPQVVPDVLLVPGVAFDSSLFRLGYGGGFYDRTIVDLLAKRPRLDTIGLAFADQMVDTLPVESHDVPMAMVLTEAGLSVTK